MKKKCFIVLLLLIVAFNALHASEVNVQSLQNTAKTVLDFFTSTPMRLLIAIALGAIGVAFIMNRQNEEMKKKLAGWAIGVAVILGAQQITDMFFTSGALFR
jgi:type IV secretory pathway VirB2 component (pilin)